MTQVNVPLQQINWFKDIAHCCIRDDWIDESGSHAIEKKADTVVSFWKYATKNFQLVEGPENAVVKRWWPISLKVAYKFEGGL